VVTAGREAPNAFASTGGAIDHSELHDHVDGCCLSAIRLALTDVGEHIQSSLRPAHSGRVHIVIFNLTLRAIANQRVEDGALLATVFVAHPGRFHA
jgi:hypothetical protein